MTRAQLYLGILRSMGGYTLSSLKKEDPELLQLLYIEHLGNRKDEVEGEIDDAVSSSDHHIE